MKKEVEWIEAVLAWWNMGNRADDVVEEAMVEMIRKYGITVLSLQEAADRLRPIQRVARRCDMNYWPGDGSPGAASTPMLVANGVPCDRFKTKVGSKRTRIGKAGAGPSTAKTKVINRLRIYRAIVVINNHLLPSIVQDHLSNTPIRRRLTRNYLRELVRIIKRVPKRMGVASGGDHNGPASLFLFRVLRFMKQVVKKPTHHKRTIDLVWLLRLTLVWVKVLEMPSDHDIVIVKVKKKRKVKK